MPAKALVFCRAGERSLHRRWLGDPATRSYDVWLDCYCDPAAWAGEAARVVDGRGTTKWPRVARLLAEDPAAFAGYDVVWFPDDDLDVDAAAVERFLAIFRAHRLALAQPALTDGSYWSHELTVACPAFTLRYTNFVEVMAPAFSRDALARCAESLALSTSGWGLDFVWPRLLGDPEDGIAIVDETPMVHTRPVGGGGSYAQEEAARDTRALADRYGVALPFRFRQHGGVRRRDGARVGDGLAFAAALLRGPPPSQRWRVRYWDLVRRTLRR